MNNPIEQLNQWRAKQKQKKRIDAALPAALDLMALVMQAGLDFQVALQKYVQEGPAGPLKEEWTALQQELALGASRKDALKHLAQHTCSDALRETARALTQGLELGSSLAPLLKMQARSLRQKMAFAAEKKAAQAPLKLLFPLFVFIFPTILAVLIGPIIMSIAAGGS
jgi:tight adherence protein C